MKSFLRWLIVLGFVSSAIAQQPPTHAFLWTEKSGLQDLGSIGSGSSYANAINKSGEVVGYFINTAGESHAFLWAATSGMQDLGTLGGGYSAAWAINDSGEVVGSSYTVAGVDDAFLWTASGGMQDLGNIGGSSAGSAVNNNGVIVGTCGTGPNFACVRTPSGHWVNLGTLGGDTSYGYAINAHNQIVGASLTASGVQDPFLWTQKSGMQDLGTLGGKGAALGVNSGQEVVGFSTLPGGSPFHAFIWTQSEGMQDLGAFNDFSANSDAFGINYSGFIVGYACTDGSNEACYAAVWDLQREIHELGSLGGSFSTATAINNSGQIVGWSNLN